MRNLILQRLEEIKIKEENFNKDTMRWRNFTLANESTHISDVNFRALSDTDLLTIFERVIRMLSKQM